MNAIVETTTLIQLHTEYTAKILASIDTSNQTEDEQWHFRRSLGIGGSEAGTILGLNKYQTAWDLWAIKTGRMPAPDLSDNMAVKMGHKLEQTVAELYAEVTGKQVRRSNIHHQHKEKPWLVGNLDRVVVGEKRGLECKTASSFAAKGKFGKGNQYSPTGELVILCDEVPDTYLIQVQHYMAVTGLTVFDLAVLIDGRDFRIFTIHRNDDLIAEIESQLTAFWFDNVISDIAPDGAPIAESEVIKGATIEATQDITSLIDAHKELAEAINELKAEQDKVDEAIKSFIGDSEILVADGHQLASYKTVNSNRFDTAAFKKSEPALYQQYVKQSSSRSLRVS